MYRLAQHVIDPVHMLRALFTQPFSSLSEASLRFHVFHVSLPRIICLENSIRSFHSPRCLGSALKASRRMMYEPFSSFLSIRMLYCGIRHITVSRKRRWPGALQSPCLARKIQEAKV